MEKQNTKASSASARKGAGQQKGSQNKGTQAKRPRKLTEYGRQLLEKQTVKFAYGMREKQFRRFFAMAARSQEATGDMLLTFLERRLDNVVYRLKLATTRSQARQAVVHGHIYVNGKKVHSPSYLVSLNDEISVAPKSSEKAGFVSLVVDKRLQSSAKVPEWLESDKKGRKGRVLRFPVRADIQIEVNMNSIVELYSK